jgi:hypothetical protein
MGERNAFPFHDVDAHGCGVEEDVDEVVVEKVDLVDVEQVAVGRGQQARFETSFASLDGRLHVDASHHAILAGVDGQFHHLHGPRLDVHGLARACTIAALLAPHRRHRRIALETASSDDGHIGQEGGQPAYRGGLGRSLFAPDENATDGRVDGVEKEGLLHCILPDQGGEGQEAGAIAHRRPFLQGRGRSPAFAWSESIRPRSPRPLGAPRAPARRSPRASSWPRGGSRKHRSPSPSADRPRCA